MVHSIVDIGMLTTRECGDMRLICALCMYSKPPDKKAQEELQTIIESDDLVMVIGGLSVCVDHAPYAPVRTELAQAIAASNRDDELARQALAAMK